MNSSQVLSGATVAMVNTTAFIAAYKDSAAAHLKSGVTAANINILSIAASSSSRRLLLSSGVVIVSSVTAANANTATLTSNLNTAIASGAFTTSLVDSGFPTVSASSPATVADTSSTTTTTTTKKSYSPLVLGAIIAIAVGGFVCLCISIGGIIFCVCMCQRSPPYEAHALSEVQIAVIAERNEEMYKYRDDPEDHVGNRNI